MNKIYIPKLILFNFILNTASMFALFISNIKNTYYISSIEIDPNMYALLFTFSGLSLYFIIKRKDDISMSNIVSTIFSLAIMYFTYTWSFYFFFNQNFSFNTFLWINSFKTIQGSVCWIVTLLLVINFFIFTMLGISSLVTFLKTEYKASSSSAKKVYALWSFIFISSIFISLYTINISKQKPYYLTSNFWEKSNINQINKAFDENKNSFKNDIVVYHPTNALESTQQISILGLAILFSSDEIVEYLIKNDFYNHKQPLSTLIYSFYPTELNLKGINNIKIKKRDILSKKMIMNSLLKANIEFMPSLEKKETCLLLNNYQHGQVSNQNAFASFNYFINMTGCAKILAEKN